MAANWKLCQSGETCALCDFSSYRPTVEVLLHGEYQRLAIRNALLLVAPFPRDLDRSLNRFRACVHRQHHFKPEHLRNSLCKAREDIVVERSRAQRESRGLIHQRLNQLRMAMSLVDGTVGGQEVEIVLALGIPYRASAGSAEHYR